MIYLYLSIVILIALSIFGLGIDSYPLAGVDEPRYSQTAANMLLNHDFITPYFNGNLRYEKPILFYWEQALAFATFGVNEFAARLPSVLAATGTTICVFLLGGIQASALIAAVIFISSFSVLVFSKIAITDMSLCFFITASLTCFFLAYQDYLHLKTRISKTSNQGKMLFYAFMLMMALGFLCKGLVAIAIPLGVVLLFLIIEREFPKLIFKHKIDILQGLILFMFIGLPWYFAIHHASHGEFTTSFFLKDNFERFIETKTNHAGPIWYYIPVILVGFMPWSFFLIQAFFKNDLSRNREIKVDHNSTEALTRFNLVWIIVVFLLFTTAQTKLVTYILPIYPALALVVARYWLNLFELQRNKQLNNSAALLGFVVMIIGTVIAGYYALTKYKEQLLGLDSDLIFYIVVALIILLCAQLIAATAITSRPKVSFIVFSVGILIIYILVSLKIMPIVFKAMDSGLKQFTTEFVRIEDKLATFRLARGALPFYRKKVVKIYTKNKNFHNYLTHEATLESTNLDLSVSEDASNLKVNTRSNTLVVKDAASSKRSGLSKVSGNSSENNQQDNSKRYFVTKKEHLARYDKFLEKNQLPQTYDLFSTNSKYVYGYAK
jgi:4-amino-4-deoxy-L-arabinose transferase-like glycosyltransferase